MDNSRYPLIRLKRLKVLNNNTSSKHNWLTTVFMLIKLITPELITALESLDPERWKAFMHYFLNKYKDYLLQQDLDRASNAYYLQLRVQRPLDGSRSKFLTRRIHFQEVFHQARLAGNHYNHLVLDQMCYKFNPRQQCPVCNTGGSDDLIQLINDCPLYNPYRLFYLKDDKSSVLKATEILNRHDIHSIKYFSILYDTAAGSEPFACAINCILDITV